MFFYYCIACVVSISAKVTLLEFAAFGQCISSSWSGPLALKFQARGGNGAFNMVPGKGGNLV